MNTTMVASTVRNQVLMSRERFWRPEDFQGTQGAVAQALSRMVRTGELRRVRRGLYWRGAPTMVGMSPPPPIHLAHAVVGEFGLGPARWSAALALGLSTQVPRRESIAVAGRTPRNPGSVHYVSRSAATKRRDERLLPIEVALLEVLREWDELVEVSSQEAVARIDGLARDGMIRLERIARASQTEPPRVRERLRRLFDALGRNDLSLRVSPARSRIVQNDLALAK